MFIAWVTAIMIVGAVMPFDLSFLTSYLRSEPPYLQRNRIQWPPGGDIPLPPCLSRPWIYMDKLRDYGKGMSHLKKVCSLKITEITKLRFLTRRGSKNDGKTFSEGKKRWKSVAQVVTGIDEVVKIIHHKKALFHMDSKEDSRLTRLENEIV